MKLRIEPHTDAKLLVQLTHDEGWPVPAAGLERRFRIDGAHHVAAYGAPEAPLGTGTVTLYPLDGGGCHAWVSGMVVRRDARSAGVGRAILQALLGVAARHDARGVTLDASREGRPLYESEGFAAKGTWPRWARPDGQPRPAAPPMRIEPVADALDEVLAFDRERFGADRSALLRVLADDHPHQARVARDASGRLAGYALAQERCIGPLVADDEAAHALLVALEEAGAPAVAHVMPESAAWWARVGYAPTGLQCTRMTRGAPLRQDAHVRAIVGWAFG